MCSQPILESTSHLCAVCERWYCKYHCRRLLYLDGNSPSYVCQFCFPLFFNPFESEEPSNRGNEVGWDVAPWIPDYIVEECTDVECDVQFLSLMHPFRKRKHHCRLCGNVFCDKHCSKRVFLPEKNIPDMVRVCNLCFSL
ncbi:uncharacterized protein [Blastocystis hominis]|uniref:FYVE-type domain-containing protein n=1 Tax=Blastocystis hominis TaxID=12968 RepID=D8LWN7_BLAHO|nr:uncharacterized protein [Blastocystis hominis]CBK20226.2 unnamed protein product [Blastocystis hominis]|eukprot:XP_012894274.1 uncharacterized protein [Blastocystis hominis]